MLATVYQNIQKQIKHCVRKARRKGFHYVIYYVMSLSISPTAVSTISFDDQFWSKPVLLQKLDLSDKLFLVPKQAFIYILMSITLLGN